MKTALARPLEGSRVHFIGIGGVGMAALAELLIELDYVVSGSDLKESRITARLAARGARVGVGAHRPEHVETADHVVWSAAIPDDNPERRRAAELGLNTLSRAELLGRFFNAGRGIAVTGTHGKTTTSSMLARILDAAGFAPSYIIGGDLNDVGTGARLGTSDLVVAEADEAYGSFLHLRPALAVVTNVDADHLDHYGDQDAIDDAFVAFLARRPEDAAAVLCADDAGVARIAGRVAAPVVTYGTGDADLQMMLDATGARLVWRGEDLGPLQLGMPGRHNLLNAAGAVAAALVLGAEPVPILEALHTFGGVERRFSVRGEEDGVVVVDDYAHNPRKITATLGAARDAYPGRRIVVLFQPHLYTRTLHMAAEFGVAFEDADVVVVTDVYGARELPIPGVSGRLVSDAIRASSPSRTNAIYIPRLDDAAGFVAGQSEQGDVVLTLGAGDVTSAAGHILELLRTSGVAQPAT
jgi:UDP-N-acetylmuramate--alanine ligase